MSKTTIALLYALFAWAMVATYVSVVLHRGLAHRALYLPQWFTDAITALTSIFILYVNPKVWVAEHRLHHAYSDTAEDPDKKPGWGLGKFLWWSLANPAGPHDEHVARITRDPQLNTLVMRACANPSFGIFCQLIAGWALPFAVFGNFLEAFYAWFGIRIGGICVKAIQGYFAHSKSYGFRNFDTQDESVNLNGWFPAFLSAGESLQNNHHARPTSATHAFKPGERDFGYVLVWLYEKLGLVTYPQRNTVTPVPEIVSA